MYIIVEGMPGTGKTTLARLLAKKISADYLKSLISDTKYGNYLKELRKAECEEKLEFLYISDLLLDELRVNAKLKKCSLVRDKCYASSLAHLIAHGFIDNDPLVQNTIKEAYNNLAELAISPDVAVFIVPNLKRVKEHLYEKKDISTWDKVLTDDEKIYNAQADALEREFCKHYEDRLIRFDCLTLSPDIMCQEIINYITERRKQ